jgi:hypothetical protein
MQRRLSPRALAVNVVPILLVACVRTVPAAPASARGFRGFVTTTGTRFGQHRYGDDGAWGGTCRRELDGAVVLDFVASSSASLLVGTPSPVTHVGTMTWLTHVEPGRVRIAPASGGSVDVTLPWSHVSIPKEHCAVWDVPEMPDERMVRLLCEDLQSLGLLRIDAELVDCEGEAMSHS